jgi:hypothetical protein
VITSSGFLLQEEKDKHKKRNNDIYLFITLLMVAKIMLLLLITASPLSNAWYSHPVAASIPAGADAIDQFSLEVFSFGLTATSEPPVARSNSIPRA